MTALEQAFWTLTKEIDKLDLELENLEERYEYNEDKNILHQIEYTEESLKNLRQVAKTIKMLIK